MDAGVVEHAIPRTIYGTFLEPIGHSIYGGLWAQILENPSFEANLWSAGRIRTMLAERPEFVQSSNIGLPLPWEPLVPAQGWRYEPRWNDAANSTRSLLIMAIPGAQTGVRSPSVEGAEITRNTTSWLVLLRNRWGIPGGTWTPSPAPKVTAPSASSSVAAPDST